jgi:hypothetical protein
MSQKSRLQQQNPGIFSPEISRGTDGKSNSTELKSKSDLSAGGIFNSDFYVYDLESEGIKSSNQVPLDFSKFENHTFFNSAQANVNVAYDKLINNYPFDGTRKELENFLNGLTGFEQYVLDKFPKNLGYLVFSGTSGLGRPSIEGNHIRVKDFSGANFKDFSRDISGDSVLSFDGKSFSIENHVLVPAQANGNEVIAQKLSGSSMGFTLALSESASTSTAEIVCAISSGSVSISVSGTLDKNKFNHVCAVYDRDQQGSLSLFVNQAKVSTSVKKALLGELDFKVSPMIIGSGSAHDSALSNNLAFTPNATFSGSLDEFKIFHKARSLDDLRQSSERGIFPAGDLKAYFKFNEPSASFGNNAIVLDSSGNSLHSTITNYVILNRETGSFPVALKSESRKFNPVLFPKFGKVIKLNEDLLFSGSEYDENNPNLITRLIPSHYLDEGRDYFGFEKINGEIQNEYTGSSIPGSGRLGSTQILSALLFTWAKQFDEIKIAADQFSNLYSPSYDDNKGVSDAFLGFLAKHYGLELPPILTDADALQFYHGENVQGTYGNIENSLQKIRSALLKRLLVNVRDIITSKGTVHSIKTVFRSLGLDPDILVRIKEYGGPKKFSLSSNRSKRAVIFPSLNFSSSLFAPAAPSETAQGLFANSPHVISPYLSGARIEPGYPQAQGPFVRQNKGPFHGVSQNPDDGLFTSGSWTVALSVKFPGLVSGSYAFSQSLARLHVTGTSAPSTKHGVVANLLALSGSRNKVKLYVRSALSSSNTTEIPPLELALTGVNVMDGDRWSIHFGRFRNDDPGLGIKSNISSSYFIRAAKQFGGQITNFYATSSFYKEDELTGSAVAWQDSSIGLNESGSFFLVGSQSIYTPESRFSNFLNGLTDEEVGTKTATESRVTDFQGLLGFARFFSKGLNIKETREQFRNPLSTGVEDPRVNFNFSETPSGSFQQLRLDLSFGQRVTGSNSSGEAFLLDLSQNLKESVELGGFEATKDLFSHEKVFFSSLASKFDEAESEVKVRPRSFVSASNITEFEAMQAPLYEFPPDFEVNDDPRFSIDFSVANALNEDIINIFSTLDSIDNAIGSPELMYSQDYPQLENLRDIYFDKLTEKINFKNFLDFFRWFDKSIGSTVEGLIPKKTKFLGTNFVIEPHSLERAKLQYQTFDMFVGEDFRDNLKGTLLLQQIAGRLRRF